MAAAATALATPAARRPLRNRASAASATPTRTKTVEATAAAQWVIAGAPCRSNRPPSPQRAAPLGQSIRTSATTTKPTPAHASASARPRQRPHERRCPRPATPIAAIASMPSHASSTPCAAERADVVAAMGARVRGPGEECAIQKPPRPARTTVAAYRPRRGRARSLGLPDARKEERARLLQHLARDHEALDLVRALVDLRDLRVASCARPGIP